MKLFQRFKDKYIIDKNLHELLYGSSVTFLLKIIGMVVSYGIIWQISRQYGSEGVGIYNLTYRIVLSAGIVCALGFNVSVLRYVGEYSLNKNNGGYLKTIFNYFLQFSAPVSIFFGIILYFFSDEIATRIFDNILYIIPLKIIAVALPFFTVNLISVEFIRGLKKLKVSEFLRSTSSYIIIFIILSLSFLSAGIIDAIYALAIGIVITFITSLLFILNELKKLKYTKEPVNLSRKVFILTSAPMMVTTTTSFILAFSGVFFLELFTTTNVVGVFSLCYMLAQLVSLPLTVVNTISAPKFSELFWNNQEKELKKVIFQSSKLIFWSSFIVSIALIIGSKLILSFFDSDFISGQHILIILIFGQIVNAMTGSVGIFLNMTGHQKVLRNIMVTVSIMIVAGYYIFVPIYGMIGAAIVSISGTIMINIFSAYYVFKKLNYVTFYMPFLKLNNE